MTTMTTAAISIALRAATAHLYRSTPRVLLPHWDAALVEAILFEAPRALVTAYDAEEGADAPRGVTHRPGSFLTRAPAAQPYDLVFVTGISDAALYATMRIAHESLSEGGLIIAEMADVHTIRPLAKRAHEYRSIEGFVRWASARCVEVHGHGADRQVVVLHHRHEESFAHA